MIWASRSAAVGSGGCAALEEAAIEDDSDALADERAAVHFVLLAAGEANDRTFWGAVAAEPDAIEAAVISGVRAFLRA
ncbi:hypothetical protein, partial [Nocardia asiatica]|uniref:hypothetical protein n=1 Tax=Nocardia asiatica TaxID=209252 RepID=UPI002454D287